MDFVPADINIKVGDTVKWEWVQSIHNVESGTIENGRGVPDGNFRSGNPVGPPATYELTFNQAFLDAHPMPQDHYPYYCIVHVGVDMKGSVTVAECLTNADCDDRLFCTGVETCEDGACLNGLNPCREGQTCDEQRDVCIPACVRDPAWRCDGDVDGNGVVNPVDVGIVQAFFGNTNDDNLCQYDIDCNGAINPVDAGIVQSFFGACEEPRDVCP
jgi:plastocyanin